MELLNRYRNISVLLLVIFAQLVLLAYQVKSQGDVRLIRVWAVTAITPVAKVVDTVRSGVTGVVRNYLLFKDLRSENEQLKRDLSKLKLEAQQLRSELETADRLKALATFQAQSPSRTLPARVIATGTGANSRVIFLDRGSRAAVMRGMAVITADGIVGKVIGSYPTAAQVLLITDPTFAAGVISQKHHVRGMVRGLGQGNCRVDYIQNEENVEPGEKFFTSGDDGVFPRGLPVGTVTVVRLGTQNKEVFLAPSGLQAGLEEVLVIVEGVHQNIPDLTVASKEVHVQPSPGQAVPVGSQQSPGSANSAQPERPAGRPEHLATEADKLREKYRALGEAQGHVFGEGLPGSRPPDFNLTPEEMAARAARAKAAAAAKAATQTTPGSAPPAADGTKPQAPPAATPPKPATP